MKIVASGHAGLDTFAAQEAPVGSVMSLGSWPDVLAHWGEADGVLIGERLPGFRAGLEWIISRPMGPTSPRVIIWVSEQFVPPDVKALERCATIWRGEIDAQRLRQWWGEEGASTLRLDRRFAVVSVFPYHRIADLADRLGGWANEQWGMGGGFVDLENGAAELSLTYCPGIYERDDYPFESRRVQTHEAFRVIAASPPWRPGSAGLDAAEMHRLLELSWAWQGWYLGAEVGRREAIDLLGRVKQVVLWTSPNTPPWAVDRVSDFCRLYQPHVEFAVVSADQLILPGNAPSSAVPAPKRPRLTGWITPRKKGY